MRNLVALEIRPDHPIFQSGLDTLIKHMWSSEWCEDDVCVVAMLVSLLTYGRREANNMIRMNIIFMIAGIFSFIKPEIVGADFYWRKYKSVYLPSWRKSENPQYHRQIKIVGVGLVFATLFSMVYFTVT